MKTLLATIPLFLLGATTPQEAITPSPWSSAIPPVRYQGVGAVPVVFVPSAEIATACAPVGEPPEGMVIIACTRTIAVNGQLMVVVVMPDPCEIAELDYYAAIQCHENAHYLTGWGHEE